MKAFLSRFHAFVRFVLCGFDRVRFCCEARLLNHAGGAQRYCHQQRIRFKDFPAHAEQLTKTLRSQTVQRLGDVPLQHLNSPDLDTEAAALQLAQKHERTTGRIAVLTCQENGLTYRIRKNKMDSSNHARRESGASITTTIFSTNNTAFVMSAFKAGFLLRFASDLMAGVGSPGNCTTAASASPR